MPPWRWVVVEADLDPVVGSEQSGRRPVLIVSREAANLRTANVTIVPVTGTQRRLYPTEVAVAAGVAGLTRASILMTHQVRTISKLRLGRPYGVLLDEQLRRNIQYALTVHLDLP